MRIAFMTVLLPLVAASAADAHEGPRIWIGNIDGRIATFRSDNDFAPATYTPCRLFATEMEPFFNVFTTEFPGYEVRHAGGDIPAGTTIGFNLAGPALYFDVENEMFVSVDQMFGPPEPGPTPQIAVSLGSSLRVTGQGPVAGFDFFTFFGFGDHSHIAYTLLGDGATAGHGPTGVYAISMTLTSAALETSEIYYLLLGKDVGMTDPEFELALDVARSSLIGVGLPGDMDCSGAVDPADIPDFVAAVLRVEESGPEPACCSLISADMNGDGELNGIDVEWFTVACFGD